MSFYFSCIVIYNVSKIVGKVLLECDKKEALRVSIFRKSQQEACAESGDECVVFTLV